MRTIGTFIRHACLFALPAGVVYFGSWALLPSTAVEAFQCLQDHQQDKIEFLREIETVFLGDSSLGHALDAEYFSELSGARAMNVALTGYYGFAGSYNFLKQVHRRNPGLRRVVLVQSLDMPVRDVSYRGYTHTMDEVSDFTELSLSEMRHVLPILAGNNSRLRDHLRNALESASEAPTPCSELIQDDYMQQGDLALTKWPEQGLRPGQLQPENLHFLGHIARYCADHELQITYVHGPVFEDLVAPSQEYTDKLNEEIESTGIQLVHELVGIPVEQVGDTINHVRPQYKRAYTERYWSLLAPTWVP
jgi:hypothetical protein